MTEAENKNVLVTGAAHRIGRAIAISLGKAGWGVAVHYNSSTTEAAAVVREIEDSGGRAAVVSAALDNESEVGALIARSADAIGPLSCLINNASVFEGDTARTASRESWDRHMETNLRAPFHLSQQFAAALAAGTPGNIINLIDQRVWNLTPYFVSYTVSKSGLWTLTQSLALAFAPDIRVNAIGPGPALASSRQTEEEFARQCAATPLGLGPSLEEICSTVAFILGASSMTGQMIALDGGQHLGWSTPPPREEPLE
jgi:NAD(P)-dependent dehydrogenase (short-subunit alcohol dehydrogenase family)